MTHAGAECVRARHYVAFVTAFIDLM